MVPLLKMAAHPDVPVTQGKQALLALIVLLIVRILDQAPFPRGMQCRRVLLRPFVHPFTEPPISPLTKYFCKRKKIVSGISMEINAADVSRCQSFPLDPTRSAIFIDITCTLGWLPMKISDTR
ncbi:hypothetical protein D3C81_1372650 [compost metagenome]